MVVTPITSKSKGVGASLKLKVIEPAGKKTGGTLLATEGLGEFGEKKKGVDLSIMRRHLNGKRRANVSWRTKSVRN